ncbi:MAG: hypothetical protein IJL02_05350 [Methanobrevibacter sp.]|uniref:hypothetical protein n=1 Tax=Methanobrevibacter sp. TaxID=66852 RepID=UPI0025D3E674|nr:hypothetical protein [Methanobrevibacter sp.]MBQ6099272.1 hypothetical protein [Methanobrevibacter sp.]
MGLFDRFKKSKNDETNGNGTERVIIAGSPQQIKEELKVDSSNVDVESVCRYYDNGKCNVETPSYPCSFKNPQNCENCPVWRYNALGDVSALF